MEALEKIAMLIDADNTQLSKLEDVIQEISKLGRIIVKRAYGNWRKDSLKHWESELKRLAIRAEQQFDYVSGKNATDIALVIDAMKLMHSSMYDGFVLVSSDSDYTPLAICLHESGIYVMGVGTKDTPEAFKNSCDEFFLLENIGSKPEPPVQETQAGTEGGKSQSGQRKKKKGSSPMDEIHQLLRSAWDTYQDDDGYALISNAGSYLKRVKPDFDVRTFGYVKLSKLIEAFPDRYETKASSTPSVKVYRCR